MKDTDPTVPHGLAPRKTPVQTRSGATVEAIFEATIQVLLADGATRLTTTRVTERAGVSVGTLYQYFPNKQALLFAMLERHFDEVVHRFEELADTVERVCADGPGQPIVQLAESLADAYVSVKVARPDRTMAMYQVAGAIDRGNLAIGLYERLKSATVRVLAHASDASFSNVGPVVFTLLSTVSGLVRATFENPAAGSEGWPGCATRRPWSPAPI
ncbi:TetR/AcrR family transcriptional regulator [Streptomyces cinereospinus]